jgi:hypothetical protein
MSGTSSQESKACEFISVKTRMTWFSILLRIAPIQVLSRTASEDKCCRKSQREMIARCREEDELLSLGRTANKNAG